MQVQKQLLHQALLLPLEHGELSLLLQNLPPAARRDEVAIYQKLVQSAK